MEKTILLPSDKCEVMEADWGSLTWYANAAQGNSQEMNVGKCIIHPGRENPRGTRPLEKCTVRQTRCVIRPFERPG